VPGSASARTRAAILGASPYISPAACAKKILHFFGPTPESDLDFVLDPGFHKLEYLNLNQAIASYTGIALVVSGGSPCLPCRLPLSRVVGGSMKIYLAGLFSTAEQEFNSRLKQHLVEYGHEVWLPQYESDEQTGEKTATEIFTKDVEGIDWADVVVANMDGPDPDSGTCWECGYAYRNKPVVIFRTDFRIEGGIAPYNLMLTESATKVVTVQPFSSSEAVAQQINHALLELTNR